MALHLTSCVAHGFVDTNFGDRYPAIAQWLDHLNHDAEAFVEHDGSTMLLFFTDPMPAVKAA